VDVDRRTETKHGLDPPSPLGSVPTGDVSRRALIDPHGGRLVDLLVAAERRRELTEKAGPWPSWDLTPRQLCDLELLLCGAFSPLRGFLGRSDYESVCASLRLADGTLWPIPIMLDLPESVAGRLGETPLALRDPEGVLLAVLHVREIWRPDREAEARLVFGTNDGAHPGVAYLRHQTHPCYVSGILEGVQPPVHYDFGTLRLIPAELRAILRRRGWAAVVAFQTRNPLHRAHLELTLRAAREVPARLLVHPVVGTTKEGDIDHYTRVRCYLRVMSSYPPGTAMLSLLPLAMRMAGPREALWHAIIRKNYGASHFIVGRDHAGPGVDPTGRPFYPAYQAQELLRRHERELEVRMVPYRQMVYVVEADGYVPEDEVPAGARVVSLSGTEQRHLLRQGKRLPSWFTPPAVADELHRRYPPRARQGVTVFLTGLPGAGKSTLAKALLARLLEQGARPITLLDGDLVRRYLSPRLGYSKQDRTEHIRRMGLVAAEVTKHGGIAVCAQIAPYDAVRNEVRSLVEDHGGFLLVHVATPADVCEARDRKGLYAKARAGLLPSFTGVSDPYEPPADAELVIDTTSCTPEQAVNLIVGRLVSDGYLQVPTEQAGAEPAANGQPAGWPGVPPRRPATRGRPGRAATPPAARRSPPDEHGRGPGP
jgi:sulfate adenylyltransferase